jgi:hypothetical protein
MNAKARRGHDAGGMCSQLRSEDSRGLLALVPKTDADIRTDQGQHYGAAVFIKDAAEEKAETIFPSRTAGRGSDREDTLEARHSNGKSHDHARRN